MPGGGAPDPVRRSAATRLGLTLEEYDAHLQRGEKWCGGCRSWHPRSAFGGDRSRGDGLSTLCREQVRAKSSAAHHAAMKLRVPQPRPVPDRCRSNKHDLVGDNLLRTAEGGWRCLACFEDNRAEVARREAAEWRAEWDAVHAGHDITRNRNGHYRCRTCIRGDHDIDEIAVERAESGDPPSTLTPAEREAAILHLRSYGLTYALIAERVGCCLRTAWHVCDRVGLTDVATARAVFRESGHRADRARHAC